MTRYLLLLWSALTLSLCATSQELGTSRQDTTVTDSSEYQQDIYIDHYKARRVYLPFEIEQDSSMADTVLSLLDYHNGNAWNLYKTSSGNSFSPGYSLRLDDPIRIGPRLGYDSYVLGTLYKNRDEHFQSDVAITNLYYSMATKSEQEFNGIHRHSLSQRFDFSVRLHKQNSPGFYSGEKNNTSYFGAQTYWTSKNLHWQNELYFRRVSLQYNQNGGLFSDTVYDSPAFDNLRLAPTPYSGTNLQNLRNGSRWLDRHNAHELGAVLRYIMGKAVKGSNDDSTQTTYALDARAYMEWGLEQRLQRYDMYFSAPDSLSLGELGLSDLATLDTLGTLGRLRDYKAYMAYAIPLSTVGTKSALRAYVDYTYSEYNLGQKLNNIGLGGVLSFSNKTLNGIAKLHFVTAGSHVGNLAFDTRLSTSKTQLKSAVAYSFRRSSAPLFYTQNKFYTIYNETDLKPETHQHLTWDFRYKWLQGGAGVHSYYNYIYAQTEVQKLNSFRNQEGLANIYYAKLGVRLESKRWGTETEVYGQRVPVSFVLTAPSGFIQSKVYMHGAWFKGRMDYFMGLQLSLSTAYRASTYDLFYNNWASSLVQTPSVRNYDVSFFLNFKVSRAKLFLRFSQLNQLFMSNYSMGVMRNYSGEQPYNYIGSPNFGLRFGVSWFMIN